MAQPRIFASGVYGSDYDVWGAWSFTDAGTRNKLGREIGPDDYCLAIGMMSERDVPEHERGRLLSLVRIAPEPILTADLVHPDKWRESVIRYGQRWLYGFPIRYVERFVDPPLRADVLPRIKEQNLFRTVGRHYLELTPDESERVLALPRRQDTNIYTTPISAFARKLLKRGPRPSQRTRTLSPKSGPAATYCLELSGPAYQQVVEPLALESGVQVFKVGFSTDPNRRLGQINAYLPCEESLCWRIVRTQWHEDEINAWAMEQRVFDLLRDAGVDFLKGEIISASEDEIVEAWQTAIQSAVRPDAPIAVPIDD